MISKSVRSYLVTNLHKQGLSPAKMVTQIQVFNFSWWVTIKQILFLYLLQRTKRNPYQKVRDCKSLHVFYQVFNKTDSTKAMSYCKISMY